MTHKLLYCLVGTLLLAPAAQAQSVPAAGATFAKDVAPILQRSCQRCHNDNGVAPMSLITYEQARPYARAIKQRTTARTMPPWFIEKNFGVQKFKEDISLTDAEIVTLGRWADAGAPMGNPADMPPPIKIAGPDEWVIGKPDLIVSSKAIKVNAVGPDFFGVNGMDPTPIGLRVDRYA